MGSVPHYFQSLFEYLSNKGDIDINYLEFPEYSGEQFLAKKNRPFDAALFSEPELTVLNKITTTFKPTSTIEMVKISCDLWRQLAGNHTTK